MPTRKIEVELLGDERSLTSASGRKFATSLGVTGRNVAKGLTAAGAALAGLGIIGSKSFSSFETTLSQIVGLAGGSGNLLTEESVPTKAREGRGPSSCRRSLESAKRRDVGAGGS